MKKELVATLLLAALPVRAQTPATAPPPLPQASPASPGAGAAKQLDKDTELASPSGTTFTVANGWWVTAREGDTLLEDPDRELQIVLLELSAASGEEAIVSAWKRVKPDFARPVYQTYRPPAQPPWDEVVQSVYDVPAQEARTVVGAARRAGATWYVALIDGPNAAMGRRNAQLVTTLNGLKPRGAQEESLAGRTAKPLDAAAYASLDAFVRKAMADVKVPGAALAVLQGGKIVHEAGFGVRELGKPGPVSPETLFLIGSISKPFTTLMMARLVDEGRFSWDTKVTAIAPAFALGDPSATAKLEMRHTVCACTGLPRQDMEFLFEFARVTPEERIRQLSTMKPTTGFGETFQYSNALVSAGGYLAARAVEPKGDLEVAYERVMREKVLGPLGMTRSTFDFTAAEKAEHATPHGYTLRDEPEPIPVAYELAVRSVAPAGGLWSSAHEMARWVALELTRGVTPDGVRVVSEKNLMARRDPMARITDKMQYGLGLILQKDRNLNVVFHDGNTLGMSAAAFWLPDADVGAVLLTNASGANALAGAVKNRLMELWFNARPRAEAGLAFAVKARAEGAAKESSRVADKPEMTWFAALKGRWRNASLGDLDVREEKGAWVLDAGEWKGRLGQYRDVDGGLLLALVSPPFAGFTFIPGEHEGKKTLLLETAQQKYYFERVN